MLQGYVLGEAQVFQQISKVNKQSLEQVKGINQDAFGFMWFATPQGVFRYDGHQLVPLIDLAADSLLHSDRKIRNIIKDEKGQLWFCGYDGAFFSINPATFETKFYTLPTAEAYPNNSTFDVYSDGENLYIASESAMFIIHIENDTLKVILPADHLIGDKKSDVNTIYGITPDYKDKNKLWVLTRGGLMSYNKTTDRFKYHTKTYNQVVNYMTTQLWIGDHDENGILWLGGGSYGLKAFDTKKEEWIFHVDSSYYPNTNHYNIIREFYKKSDSAYWVMSIVDGLGTLDLNTNTYHYFPHEPDNLQSIQVGGYNRMFKDQDGNFWIGGVNGISFYNPALQKVQKIKYPTRRAYDTNTPVHTMSWEQINEDMVLVGTMLANGLYKADLKNRTLIEVDKLIVNSKSGKQTTSLFEKNNGPPIIRDIFKTKQGDIFVTDNQDLFLYELKKNQLESCHYPFALDLINTQKSNFIEDQSGNYWCLLNYWDVVHIDGKTKEVIKRYPHAALIPKTNQNNRNILNQVSEDQSGNIWVSSSFNLSKIDQDGVVHHQPFNESDVVAEFARSQIKDFAISSENKMYIVSLFGGLLELNLNKPSEYKMYNDKNGLASENLLHVDIDQSNQIWITTDNGLVLFNPRSEKTFVIKKEHGLVEDNLNRIWIPYIEISKFGQVFLYTPDYFSWLKADSFTSLNKTLNARINAFEFLDDPLATRYNLSHEKEIETNYNQNYFKINFGTDRYSLTEYQNFKYQLSGFDKQWRSSSDAFASYTNVPPGEYTFSVLASDFMGNWTADPATLNIKINPPFWKTSWFKLLMFLLILGLIILLYRFWANQIREKERLKSEFEKKISQIEMDALRAQMNPHFLFNCLNSIRNYALTKGPYETGDYITKFSYLIRLILQNSKSPRVLLVDELEALKLYIEIEDLRFENQFDYEIKVDEDLDLNSIYLPPLILQPYVENAIWHGLMHKLNGKGKLLVELKHIPGSIQCTIEDNGIGREKAAEIKERMNSVHKKSLGMQITKDRIELTNQLYKTETSVEIIDLKNDDGEGVGTRILVNIPILHGEV